VTYAKNEPLNCFPSRVDWEQVKIRENAGGKPVYGYRSDSLKYREQYLELLAGRDLPPPPITTSRDPLPREVPAPVTLLAAHGGEHAWQYRIQYSRGYAVKYRGAWQQEELFAVRFMRLDGFGAFAVYRSIAGRETWTWRDVWMWGVTLLPFGQGGVTDLKEWLTAKGEQPDSWYGEISKRVAEQEERTKLRDRFRPEVKQAVNSFTRRYSGVAWPALLAAACVETEEIRKGAEDLLYTLEDVVKFVSAAPRAASGKREVG
jgi:hypothetical protein